MDSSTDMDTDSDTDGRWLTYAELAEARRIDKPSAMKLAIRRGWPRRKNNHGQMQVCVPENWLAGKDNGTHKSVDIGTDLSRTISALEAAVASLTERAQAAEKRADKAEEGRAGAEQTRDAARAELAAVEGRLREAEQARAEFWRKGRLARLRAVWRGRG